MSEMNRRTFFSMAGAAAATGLTARAAFAPNDTVRVAVIGLNGRGNVHMQHFAAIPNVKVAVLCDVDRVVLDQRADQFEKRHGYRPDTETDLRKVYDRKDVDAVGVATPNHWHTLAAVWACQAGKDVYVEKPGSHNVFEGRKLIEAAHKHKRIVQHGVQLRSCEAVQEAVEHLRNGSIGKVYMARGLVLNTRPSIGHFPDSETPPTLDWDIWQGPAHERAFSKGLVHYNWHWHWAYGNGDIANQGVHQTDMCLWGLGLETMPSEITAMGGKFLWDDDKETPEVLSCNYYFPKTNQMIEFEVRPWYTNTEADTRIGNVFYGSEGWLVVKGYRGYELYLKDEKEPKYKRMDPDPLRSHFENFISAVRDRNEASLRGPVETAHTSCALAHLGNIAFRMGRKLKFDPSTEKFVGDTEADGLLTRDYRAPFIVPETV